MALDPTNRASIRRAEKAARAAEREQADVVKALMQHKSGRKYFYDKLVSANVFATTFHLNALQMAFNEGVRHQGLQLILDIMKFCPEQYILMMREANERDAASTAAEHSGGEDRDGGDQGSGSSGNGRDEADRDPGGLSNPVRYEA